MPRVRLIHWNAAEGRERTLRLASHGVHVEFDDFDAAQYSRFMRRIRENPPDAFLIDLSRMPSHGREIAVALRSYKDTRHVPLVFVDGVAEKVARIKSILPDATYTTWSRIRTALPRAIARPVKAPAAPRSEMFYTGKPVADKLGIKAGMRVCVLNAPPGLSDTLAPLPDGVVLTARSTPASDLYLMFARSRRELVTQLELITTVVNRETVWVLWPKIAAKVLTDLNGNVVRETGLGRGWVDFKICSVDTVWSALAFKRRHRR